MEIRKVTDRAEKANTIALRWKIFIAEQGINPEEEFDNNDVLLPTFEAWQDGQITGTARLKMLAGAKSGKIERFGIAAEARGKGVGKALVSAMVADLREQGAEEAVLSAQVHAIPFYEKNGFEAFGEEYMDAGIPHKDMKMKLKN